MTSRFGEASVQRAEVLFACVRGDGEAPLALARDFSPRIERYGNDCVVLDVSGLGRLLGDAHGIAAELARSADDRGIKRELRSRRRRPRRCC